MGVVGRVCPVMLGTGGGARASAVPMCGRASSSRPMISSRNGDGDSGNALCSSQGMDTHKPRDNKRKRQDAEMEGEDSVFIS